MDLRGEEKGSVRGRLPGNIRRFNHGRHRPLAARNPPVGTIGMDLVPLRLGPLLAGRINDHPAGPVYGTGHLESRGTIMSENISQHLNDIFISMLIIIEEYHMVPGGV